jgi:hypothetical protein
MQHRTTMTIISISATLALLAAPAAAESIFHVGPGGDDAGPGSIDRPFATLERARAAVRSAGPGGRRTVIVRGGPYEIREAFVLGPENSGTESDPVTWTSDSEEKVLLIGGRSIPPAAFRPVEDPAVLARLDPAAAGGRVLAASMPARRSSRLPGPPSRNREGSMAFEAGSPRASATAPTPIAPAAAQAARPPMNPRRVVSMLSSSIGLLVPRDRDSL